MAAQLLRAPTARVTIQGVENAFYGYGHGVSDQGPDQTLYHSGGNPGVVAYLIVTRMAVWPDGRIVVEDLRRLAYHVFGPDGEFERMVRVVRGNLGITMRYPLRTDRTGEPTLVGRMPYWAALGGLHSTAAGDSLYVMAGLLYPATILNGATS